jgi:hypothetical protein
MNKHFLFVTIYIFITFNSYSQEYGQLEDKNLLKGKWKLIKYTEKDVEHEALNLSDCAQRNYLEFKDSILIKTIHTDYPKPCLKTVLSYRLFGLNLIEKNRGPSMKIISLNDSLLVIKYQFRRTETYLKVIK